MNNRHPWPLKKSKSWGLFWSYQSWVPIIHLSFFPLRHLPANLSDLINHSYLSIVNECSTPIAIEKIKILVAVLELPAKQHCQSSPFTSKLGKIGQIGSAVHCCQSAHIFWVYYFSHSQCVSFLSASKCAETRLCRTIQKIF